MASLASFRWRSQDFARSTPPPSCSDNHIPAHVKRAVWKRDGGKCQWPVAGGGICGSTTRLEFAHRKARAHGGKATVDNLRLLCHVHNQFEARIQLGDAFHGPVLGDVAARRESAAGVQAIEPR